MGETQTQFLALCQGDGIPLTAAGNFDWLTSHGYRNAHLVRLLPDEARDRLEAIYIELRGDVTYAGSERRLGSDFFHTGLDCIVELDESQHFTTERGISLRHYTETDKLGFDFSEYVRLVGIHRSRADRDYAHKRAKAFDFGGGRRAQRAYYDALRDLAAPHLTGNPLIRVAAPERNATLAVQRLKDWLERGEVR